MHINTILAVAGLTLTALAAQAGAGEARETVIDIARHPVPVLAGGLYDRYRSNPPLSVIAKEAPEADPSWFKTLTKTKRDLGFATYSPNLAGPRGRGAHGLRLPLLRQRQLQEVLAGHRRQPAGIAETGTIHAVRAHPIPEAWKNVEV